MSRERLEIIAVELINDSKFYKDYYPLFEKIFKGEDSAYSRFRGRFQHFNSETRDAGKKGRSIIIEKLFHHYYSELCAVNNNLTRNFLHEISPIFHDSIYVTNPCNEIPQPTKEKKITIMSSIDNKKAVQTVTYVFGKDVSDMKDQDYYDLIRTLEKEIKEYEGIDNKPKKLVAKIEEIKAAIKSIVELMDNQK